MIGAEYASGPVGADVTICGLGYVGLALAREASASGLRVSGYDVDERVVSGLARGRSHVDDITDEDVAAMLERGFRPSADPAALSGSPVVVVCVPTPLDNDGEPDLEAVRDAAAAIAPRLRPGTLVALESTSFPGTTEEVVLPILRDGSGLTPGVDFYLVFSPERIDPGNKVFTLAKTPKIVGGLTPACAAAATEFYGHFTEEVMVARGTREAEMAKLLENTYRYVNIALVNEMAMLCHRLGIDVWDVLRCAASKPFGYQPFAPGPGVGGHCIPVDPHYLAHRARRSGLRSVMIDAAHGVNSGMPAYVVARCVEFLGSRGETLEGRRVVLLGATYKADIADLRMTPAEPVAEELVRRGARVSYHDPYVDSFRVDGVELERHASLETALDLADLVILLQPHAGYRGLDLLLRERQLAVFDTRGVLDHEDVPGVAVL